MAINFRNKDQQAEDTTRKIKAADELIKVATKTPSRELRVAAREAAEEIIEDMKAGTRKKAISIRIDIDVLEWLKSGGSGWQSALNKALRAQMEQSK